MLSQNESLEKLMLLFIRKRKTKTYEAHSLQEIGKLKLEKIYVCYTVYLDKYMRRERV